MFRPPSILHRRRTTTLRDASSVSSDTFGTEQQIIPILEIFDVDTNPKVRLKTSCRGQAVIEGVMMRTPLPTPAVRRADGSVEVKREPVKRV
jgi:hypothetical protein